MAEPAAADGGADPHRLLEGLRTFGANYTEFTRRFAGWLGLHSTDAMALAEILYAEDKGTPLSPARLSERISLSSGATTALLNRLEKAGCVERRRETSDRRVVTLRSSPDVRPRAMRFFGPYTAGMEEVMSLYTDAQLDEFREFVTRLGDAMDSLLAHEYHDVEPGTTPGIRPGPDAAP
ncbi:MarR family transcriptional regulator [Streptomyces mobaraensis NBRC 13819 = DSM 40847]|uniref:MarR family transcriptional regulator n=1 Tax=Streptomyces mobaraensis (strain ATCC 29032 / DSM 40847 / JCM 4168 / NBRC 13819 / NCIMB 11159 / IPCR 16-22) TaxID=1223523 RepID=M3C0T6_STRM1|nr:MarR family transcriptional regulator [Streptomyces mobaraensis]EME97630.1 MarR family transcriptional regulator [Streptomyces mobaraensis NBRC 13819 = DSM 40847]QTT72453.1 MarR family transcriptional regulator [Streptomyces mobaraensis NBRC 13819 = DSM 40847]